MENRRVLNKTRIVNGAMDCLHAVYVLLMLSVCVVVVALPLIVASTVSMVPSVPMPVAMLLWTLGAAASVPGVAAAFAVCNDHPMLHARHDDRNESSESADSPDWIASPYVHEGEDRAVFRPFMRAYAGIWKRALAIGAAFAGIAMIGVWNLQLLAQLNFGALLMPVICVVLAVSVPAMCVAIELVVRYPKARFLAVLRNGFVLGVRGWPLSVLTAIAIGAYVVALLRFPVPAVVLGTGLLAFVCAVNARWQINPLDGALRA